MARTRNGSKTPWLLVVLLSALSGEARALSFTDPAAFLAAFPGPAATLDFDAVSAGTLIPNGSALGGITFSYSIPDGSGGFLQMAVASSFATTSGANGLGLDDPGNFDQLVDGDEFDLAFAAPVHAVGMVFITGDPLVAGDVRIETATGSAANGLLPAGTLIDGGLAYFVGLVTPGAFTEAQVRFDDGAGNFLFNVDDITTAPEPETLWLAGWVTLVAVLARNRGTIR